MRLILATFLFIVTTQAAQRFVSTAGNDTSGNGTIGNPYLTIGKAASLSSAGDIVEVRAGTYTQAIDDSSMSMPSGTSWANVFLIEAYSGEAVTINVTAQYPVQLINHSYVEISGIVFQCVNGASGVRLAQNAHHNRLRNCSILNVPYDHGILIAGSGVEDSLGGNQLISCTFSNVVWNKQAGVNDKHGAYIQLANNIFSNCVWRGSALGKSSWAIHLFTEGDGTNNIIIGNDISHNWNGGILSASGGYNQIINNRIYDDNVNDVLGGIQIQYDTTANVLQGNTIFRTGTGIEIGSGGLTVGTVIDNNIVNSTSDPWTSDIQIYPGSSGATVRNNMAADYSNAGSGTTASGNLFGGQYLPDFVDTVWPYDLEIGAASSALNAGRTASLYAYDYEGTARPQGNAWDIGMDERDEGVMPPPPGGLPIVTITGFDSLAYEEGSVDGVFTLTRDTSSGTLAVNYRLTGTAVNGTDYATLATNVTFAAGQLSTNVIVNPTDDATDEADKTIILDLWPDAAVYTLGTPTNATMTQIDNDLPIPPPPPPPPPAAGEGTGTLPRRRASITFNTNSIVIAGLSSNDLAYSYNPAPAAIVYVDRYIMDTNRLAVLEKTVAALRAEQATLRQQAARTDNLVLSLNYRQLDLHNDWTNTNRQILDIKTALRIP